MPPVIGHPVVEVLTVIPNSDFIVAFVDESATGKVVPSVPLTYPTKLGSAPGDISTSVIVHTLLTKVEVTLTSTLEKVHVA